MPKGIVYRKSDGIVLYAFDTLTYPKLKVGEALKERDDYINIMRVNGGSKGATYNPITDTYTNPA